jgi:hypothetical protein
MFRTSTKPLVVGLGAVLLLAWTASAARAQYPPGYNPYNQGGFYPGQVGGALYGSAQVINSYGELMQQSEQARLQREQVNQAKLDTKKKTLDWRNYERANTPTYTDEQLRIQGQQLQRVLNKPMPAEVTSGKAQNIILPFLQSLTNRGIVGPPIPLDPGVVSQINVTSKAAPGASLGLLRQGDHMEWPLVLQGPTQEKLTMQLSEATAAAARGKLNFTQFQQVSAGVEQLKSDLKKKFGAEEIDGGTYLTGKRFLESLEGAVGQLQKPGAAKFLDGSLSARGRTVQELVQNMTKQGLTFAPASPGSEPSYFSLHSAMVAYAAGAESSPGFRVQGGPPPGYKGPPR